MRHSDTVAQDTWAWMVSSSRASGEAIRRVDEMGEEEFLSLSAERWESEGSRRYMNGMKDVMFSIIWDD